MVGYLIIILIFIVIMKLWINLAEHVGKFIRFDQLILCLINRLKNFN